MKKKRKGKHSRAAAAAAGAPASESPPSSSELAPESAVTSVTEPASVAPASSEVASATVESAPASAEIAPAKIQMVDAAPVEAAPASTKAETEPAQAAAPPSKAAPASASAPDSSVPSAAAVPASASAPSSKAPSAKKKKKAKKKSERVSTLPATVREGKGSGAPPAISAKLEQLEAKLEERHKEAERAARKGFGSDPGLEEESIPPVVELEDHFFSSGELPPDPADRVSGSGTSGAFDAVPHSREARKMTPEAHARRAHLSRYVMMAVGACALLLLIGIVIRSVRGRPNEEPVRAQIVHAADPAPPPVTPPAAKKSDEVPTPADQAKTDEAKTDEAKTDEAKTDEAKTDEAKTDEAPAASAAKPKPAKNAWQEKATAKAALEAGANGMAIAAGERSVALDPTDAEAWLILGAAYQAKGNMVQARRCYSSCLTKGRHGSKQECKEMLRQ